MKVIKILCLKSNISRIVTVTCHSNTNFANHFHLHFNDCCFTSSNPCLSQAAQPQAPVPPALRPPLLPVLTAPLRRAGRVSSPSLSMVRASAPAPAPGTAGPGAPPRWIRTITTSQVSKRTNVVTLGIVTDLRYRGVGILQRLLS